MEKEYCIITIACNKKEITDKIIEKLLEKRLVCCCQVININSSYWWKGKIEEGETPEQTAIREMKEETGLKIKDLKYKGKMIIEYPNRIFDFEVFICNECEGKPQDFEENTSEWIEINELLKKEKNII